MVISRPDVMCNLCVPHTSVTFYSNNEELIDVIVVYSEVCVESHAL